MTFDNEIINANLNQEMKFKLIKEEDEWKWQLDGDLANEISSLLKLEREFTAAKWSKIEEKLISFKVSSYILDEKFNIDRKPILRIGRNYSSNYDVLLNSNSPFHDNFIEEIFSLSFYVQYNMFSEQYNETAMIILKVKYDGRNLNISKIIEYPEKETNGIIIHKDVEEILDFFNMKEDYKKSIICEKANLYAGACVYLRKCLEKINIKYHEIDGIDINPKKTFKESINEVKDHIETEQLQEILKDTYSLLSNTIHQLDEKEIITLYASLSDMVQIQYTHELDIQKKQKIKNETGKNLKQKIQEIKESKK